MKVAMIVVLALYGCGGSAFTAADSSKDGGGGDAKQDAEARDSGGPGDASVDSGSGDAVVVDVANSGPTDALFDGLDSDSGDSGSVDAHNDAPTGDGGACVPFNNGPTQGNCPNITAMVVQVPAQLLVVSSSSCYVAPTPTQCQCVGTYTCACVGDVTGCQFFSCAVENGVVVVSCN